MVDIHKCLVFTQLLLTPVILTPQTVRKSFNNEKIYPMTEKGPSISTGSNILSIATCHTCINYFKELGPSIVEHVEFEEGITLICTVDQDLGRMSGIAVSVFNNSLMKNNMY
jgi:hypothetical protein